MKILYSSPWRSFFLFISTLLYDDLNTKQLNQTKFLKIPLAREVCKVGSINRYCRVAFDWMGYVLKKSMGIIDSSREMQKKEAKSPVPAIHYEKNGKLTK